MTATIRITISAEGGEHEHPGMGAGKTTLAAAITEVLRAIGYKVEVYSDVPSDKEVQYIEEAVLEKRLLKLLKGASVPKADVRIDVVNFGKVVTSKPPTPGVPESVKKTVKAAKYTSLAEALELGTLDDLKAPGSEW